MKTDQLSLWDLLAEPEAQAPPEDSAFEPAPQAPVQLMPAPAGTPAERLLRVMALRKQDTPEAIGEMVAALGDEDGSIRYLAALSLQGIGGEAVVATLKAFIYQAPSELAQAEAEKVLGKVMETEGYPQF
jgi:HEAT repeat protein